MRDIDEIKLPLDDMDAWDKFATANEAELLSMYATLDGALKAACDGGLVLGGGAAPLVHVYFVD